jgi:hypothetical protein
VASRLRKTPAEVRAMPVEDFEDLLTFWRIQAEEAEGG